MIWENGVCLAQSQRFSAQQKHCVADVDLDLLCSTRRQTGVFDANRKHHQFSRAGFREIEFILDPATSVRCSNPRQVAHVAKETTVRRGLYG